MLWRCFAWVLVGGVGWFAFGLGGRAQEPELPLVTGLVTRAGSATDFDVDGKKVAVGPKTRLFRPVVGTSQDRMVSVPPMAPYLGQSVLVFGQTKHHVVDATKVIYYLPLPEIAVHGSAIVEKVEQDGHGGWMLHADGRILQVTPAMLTKQKGAQGGASAADLRPNVWIDYRGVEQADGLVKLQSAGFADNVVSKGEDKMREKVEFDAAAVSEEDQQSGLRAFFVGTDLTRIPAYKDDALQARVDAIGNKLIPEYQKGLPSGDPTKIVFRFQLVDRKWKYPVALPSGIILLPKHIAERLTDDSQLAAVLAKAVAATYEKERYRAKEPLRTLTIAEYVGAGVGLVVPGAGLVTEVVVTKKANTLITEINHRLSRVAMRMMYDAGYDVRQSPEAWWTLASGSKERKTSPPDESLYEFGELGTAWRVTLNDGAGWPLQKMTAD